MSWKNVDIAKENLQRIEDHYKFMTHKGWERQYGRHGDKPDYPRPRFMEPPYEYEDYSILLLDDDRKQHRISISWTGYFETLYGAEIISDPEDGWSFRI